MTDIAVVASQAKAVPQDYTIPGAQELLPKSVSARMNGAAAGGAWLPCLQVLDPGGHVMFSAIATSTLAAGASADVSWFPRVGSGGTSASGNLNVYHNNALVGTEPSIDIVDSSNLTWTITDVPGSQWVLISAVGGGTPTSGQAPGSYTWTNPGSGTVTVICVGAGGGGGGGNNTGAAGGGGGGGCVNIWQGNAAILPATVGYTVGAGGTGAATDGDGGNGGSSFFGSPVIVFAGGGGGGGGTGAGTNAGKGGGGGGSISSSNLSTPGSPFNTGGNTNTTTNAVGYEGAWGVDGHHKGNVAEWGGASGAGASDVAATPVGAGGSLHGGPGGGGGGTPAGGDILGSPGGGHDYTTGSGGANGRPGSAGSSTANPYCGTGGGGGNYLAGGDGASGGAGGPGAGGGGSSGFDVGKASGSGGNGGNGAVYIFVT